MTNKKNVGKRGIGFPSKQRKKKFFHGRAAKRSRVASTDVSMNEEIKRDDEFWEQHMRRKLETYYLDCILPELVDPRVPRSMEIRDPPYFHEAKLKKLAEQKRKDELKSNNDKKKKEKTGKRKVTSSENEDIAANT